MKWISSAALKQRPVRLSITLGLASLTLLFLPISAQEFLSSIIQQVFYSPFYGISHRITDVFDVYEINRELKAEISQQRVKLTALREFEKENERLRDLLGFKERYDYSVVAAEIVAVDPKRRENAVIAETGTQTGLTRDLPVVNVHGLVGKTSSVIEDYVTVELLTSPNCRAAARDANSRVLGIIRWNGSRAR